MTEEKKPDTIAVAQRIEADALAEHYDCHTALRFMSMELAKEREKSAHWMSEAMSIAKTCNAVEKAMYDAIEAPKGVVPTRADEFYDPYHDPRVEVKVCERSKEAH